MFLGVWLKLISTERNEITFSLYWVGVLARPLFVFSVRFFWKRSFCRPTIFELMGLISWFLLSFGNLEVWGGDGEWVTLNWCVGPRVRAQ